MKTDSSSPSPKPAPRTVLAPPPKPPYLILVSNSVEALAKIVNQHIEEGYDPVGGVGVNSNNLLLQAVVRPSFEIRSKWAEPGEADIAAAFGPQTDPQPPAVLHSSECAAFKPGGKDCDCQPRLHRGVPSNFREPSAPEDLSPISG